MYAHSDASGTFDVRTAQDANDRMRAAGVHVLSMFAVACELMRDWRSTPGAKEMMPFFDTCVFLLGDRQTHRKETDVHAYWMIGTFRSMDSWRGRTTRRLPTGRLRDCRCRRLPMVSWSCVKIHELVRDQLGLRCIVVQPCQVALS